MNDFRAFSAADLGRIGDFLRRRTNARAHAPAGLPDRRLWASFDVSADGGVRADGNCVVLPAELWRVAALGAALAGSFGSAACVFLRDEGIFAGGSGGRTPFGAIPPAYCSAIVGASSSTSELLNATERAWASTGASASDAPSSRGGGLPSEASAP